MDKSELAERVSKQVIDYINDDLLNNRYFRFRIPVSHIDGIKCSSNVSFIYHSNNKSIEIILRITSKNIQKSREHASTWSYYQIDFNHLNMTKATIVEDLKAKLLRINYLITNLIFSCYQGKFILPGLLPIQNNFNQLFFDESKADDTNTCFICNEFTGYKFQLRCCKKAMCLRCREKTIESKDLQANCPFGCDVWIRFIKNCYLDK